MSLTISDIIASYLASNIRFRYAWLERYGSQNHLHLFLIGERTDKPTIEVIEEIIRGQKYAELRIWYVDLELPENERYLKNIPYEYPLPISPVLITYDGEKYLYVIYNKYNIWRLDLKGVLQQPNGNWWFRLPPCLDCNFLGDSRTHDSWDSYFIKPHYLAIVSKDGKMARMDTKTFAWFFDKAVSPQQPVRAKTNFKELQPTIFEENITKLSSVQTNKISKTIGNENIKSKSATNNSFLVSATGLDKDEIYMVDFGSIGGKVMNIYDKQWDNFYFDTRFCRVANKLFSKLVNQGLYPLFIKRRRLYTINEIGHMFYSWLRIYGHFNVEYQLNDYFNVSHIRIYGDYKFLQTATNNCEIWIFGMKSGWKKIPKDCYNIVVKETDWLWDIEYFRRYVRVKITPNGDLQYEYTKLPNNYLEVNLKECSNLLQDNEPISKIRVSYKPEIEEYNYIVHINRVELLTDQDSLVAYDNPDNENQPLEIVRFQPIKTKDTHTIAYAVYVRNKSDRTIRNVKVYVYDNKFIQMKHGNENPDEENGWYRYNENNPLLLTNELNPNDLVKFYIRGINIDETPHSADVVIIGDKTYL